MRGVLAGKHSSECGRGTERLPPQPVCWLPVLSSCAYADGAAQAYEEGSSEEYVTGNALKLRIECVG